MYKSLTKALLCLVGIFFMVTVTPVEANTSSSAAIRIQAYLPKTKSAKDASFKKIAEKKQVSPSRAKVILNDLNSENTELQLDLLDALEEDFTLQIDSQNGFKLKNQNGVEVNYKLELKNSREKNADSALKSESTKKPQRNDTLKFKKDSLQEGNLLMNFDKSKELKSGEGFSDTLKLRVIAP